MKCSAWWSGHGWWPWRCRRVQCPTVVGVQDVTAVQTVVWWAQVMQLQSVAALVFLPLVISPVDRIPSQCALPWVPVPSPVIKHVNSNNPSKGCLTLGCNDSVWWHALSSILLCVTCYWALRLHIFFTMILVRLWHYLAHVRDSSGAVATPTAGAPTKTPVQGCLAIYVHIYRSLQQSGIDAYLLHWCTHCALAGLGVLANPYRVHVNCANTPPF